MNRKSETFGPNDRSKVFLQSIVPDSSQLWLGSRASASYRPPWGRRGDIGSMVPGFRRMSFDILVGIAAAMQLESSLSEAYNRNVGDVNEATLVRIFTYDGVATACATF